MKKLSTDAVKAGDAVVKAIVPMLDFGQELVESLRERLEAVRVILDKLDSAVRTGDPDDIRKAADRFNASVGGDDRVDLKLLRLSNLIKTYDERISDYVEEGGDYQAIIDAVAEVAEDRLSKR